MIVLTTDIEQTFSIIPIRETDEDFNDIYGSFTNETTKEVIDLDFQSISIKDILYLTSGSFDFLNENTFYNLKVYFINTNEVIYKDRIFCTNQNTATYSINNNAYTEPTIDNNDYITI